MLAPSTKPPTVTAMAHPPPDATGFLRTPAVTFVTVIALSLEELQTKISELNRHGFTQIGSPVSTQGVRGLDASTYICLMSKPTPSTDA